MEESLAVSSDAYTRYHVPPMERRPPGTPYIYSSSEVASTSATFGVLCPLANLKTTASDLLLRPITSDVSSIDTSKGFKGIPHSDGVGSCVQHTSGLAAVVASVGNLERATHGARDDGNARYGACANGTDDYSCRSEYHVVDIAVESFEAHVDLLASI